MTSLQWLWLGALALMVLSLAVLLPPLFRTEPEAGPEGATGQDAERLRALYQAQLTELAQQQRNGFLSGEAHAQAVEELQRRLLQELDRTAPTVAAASPWLRRISALVLAVGLPGAAFGLYGKVGDPQAVARLAQAEASAAHGADMSQQIQGMVDGLAQRLRQSPEDLAGWAMLARSYETLERYADAADAYRRAIALAQSSGQPANLQAQLWANLADALGSVQKGDLTGEAGDAIAQALQRDPQQPKALALAGTAALRRGDVAEARQHWQRLLAQLEPGSDIAMRVQDDLIRLETEGR